MTRARELGKLANRNSLTADNTNNFVGIGSTQPDARLDVDGTVLVGTAITLGGASGIVSATSFYGDGSNLDGVASAGLGTALAETQPGNVIYYTDNILGIGSTMVVTVPAGSDVAYTQYAEISLDENIDLIVSEGDDFVTDILGLSTSGISTQTGIGGRIRAGTFTNKAGTGAPQLTFGAEIPVGYGLTGAGGINVGGAVTAASGNFTGAVTVGGVLTYDDVTNVDSIGIITARSHVSIADSILHTGDTDTAIRFPAADTFTVETGGSEAVRVDSSQRLLMGATAVEQIIYGGTTNAGIAQQTVQSGDVNLLGLLIKNTGTTATVGGTLSLAHARSTANASVNNGDVLGAIQFLGGDGTDIKNYGALIECVVDGTPGSNDMPGRLVFETTTDGAQVPTERLRITSGGGFHFTNGELIERAKVTAGKLSDNTNIDLENGMVHLFTTTETTTSTPNIRINSSTSLNSVMAVGEMISVTLITTAAAAGYSAQLTIDGNAVTENWTGGSAPSDGGSSGVDIYAYTIIKTANATFTVVATQTKTS